MGMPGTWDHGLGLLGDCDVAVICDGGVGNPRMGGWLYGDLKS